MRKPGPSAASTGMGVPSMISMQYSMRNSTQKGIRWIGIRALLRTGQARRSHGEARVPSRSLVSGTEQSASVQDFCHCTKGEVLEQPHEALFHLMQVRIVPKPRQFPCGEAWLRWVQLPRMQIDDGWLPLSPVQIPDAPMGISIGEEPQIPPASNREIGPPEAERRQRKFHQRGPALSRNHRAKPGVTRNTIEVVPDGEDTKSVHRRFVHSTSQTSVAERSLLLLNLVEMLYQPRAQLLLCR